MKHHQRETCRLCLGNRLDLAVPMLPTPVGEGFVQADQRSSEGPLFPLDLHLCADCGHLQLLTVLDPQELFGAYLFTTASSPSLLGHFSKLAQAIATDYQLPKGSKVLEIGSNDGTLLRCFQELGMSVLGVDPAASIAQSANASGIETINDFFSLPLARRLREERGAFDLVLANNVFAHIDSIRQVAEGIGHVLTDSGIFVFEVSYLVDTIDKLLFDTIYHEHLCYHALGPLVTFFEGLGLQVFRAERIPSKGGSIRVFVQKSGGGQAQDRSVAQLLTLEEEKGACRLDRLQEYGRDLQTRAGQVREKVAGLRSRGARLAGYGASQTTTTLTYQLGLQDLMDCIIDDNPAKDGLYSPGNRLPVVSSRVLSETDRRPDYVIILAWLYAEPIIEKNRRYIEAGGQFILPWPSFKIAAAERDRETQSQ